MRDVPFMICGVCAPREMSDPWSSACFATGSPLDTRPELQDALRRKGLCMFAAELLVLLLVAPAAFLAFGYAISEARGGGPCGQFRELHAPECVHISWEFVVGSSFYGIFTCFMIFLSLLLFIYAPLHIRRRRLLVQRYFENGARGVQSKQVTM